MDNSLITITDAILDMKDKNQTEIKAFYIKNTKETNPWKYWLSIISPTTECGHRVTAQLNTWPTSSTYLGWRLESRLFMHNMCWASRPGGDHPASGQTTPNVFQFEGLVMGNGCWFHWETLSLPWLLIQSRNLSAQRCHVITTLTAYITTEPNLARWPFTWPERSSAPWQVCFLIQLD